MRVVHLTPFYYPVIGGVEEVTRRVAEYSASRGHNVHVVTYNRLRIGRECTLSEKDSMNDVEVIRVKPDFIWSHGTYSSDIPRVLDKLRPEVVHVHVWRHPHVFQVIKLKEKLGFKAILHTHAPFHKLSQLGLPIWFYHKIIDLLRKDILKRYNIIIALTPYEKNILSEKLNANRDKITVIPNGIDDIFLKATINEQNANSPTLLYLGRISKSKNVDLLINAMKIVRKRMAVKLILAGPDENLIIKLKHRSKKFGIDLKYIGPVLGCEKHILYSNCTIFVHPAVYEPFGITLLEAQAFGKPCVITGAGGQLYTAPPGITSLHAKQNPKDFGEKIMMLLSDKKLYRKLGSNARDWALQHLWSKILPKYDKVYDLICA